MSVVVHRVKVYECVRCGQRYPIVPYYPFAAPHGPNKDCLSREWVEVVERFVQDAGGIRYDG